MRLEIALGLMLCLGLAAAYNELEAGDGICSLCVQKDGVGRCCNGNTLCQSTYGSMECTQTMPTRDDGQPAQREFSNALYDQGSDDFCSICCGFDASSTGCCTGRASCSCTKILQPSCV